MIQNFIKYDRQGRAGVAKRASVVYVRGLFLVWLVVFMVLALSSCSESPDATQDFTPDFEILYASEDVDESSWPDAQLKSSFARYWHKRISTSEYRELLELEAPHVQEMVDFDKYRSFLVTVPPSTIDKIEIHNMIQVTDHLVEMAVRVHYIDPIEKERKFTKRDRWVKIDGDWHHVFRNPLAFPEIS